MSSDEGGEGLRGAIESGLRKCRVADDAPVALIREGDLFHITHMVVSEVEPFLADRLAEPEQCIDQLTASRDRAERQAESAEAAHAALVAGIEGLADRYDGALNSRHVADSLRALIEATR